MLTLGEIIRRNRAIVDLVLADDHGAIVVAADGAIERKVRNLGWLMRHRSDVLHPLQGVGFTVETWRYGAASPRAGGCLPIVKHDPVLIAHLSDGRSFACTWADRSVLHDWLDRPSFRGYSIDWNESGVFGSMPGVCGIGGRDYAGIAEMVEERHRRIKREHALGNFAV